MKLLQRCLRLAERSCTYLQSGQVTGVGHQRRIAVFFIVFQAGKDSGVELVQASFFYHAGSRGIMRGLVFQLLKLGFVHQVRLAEHDQGFIWVFKLWQLFICACINEI